jgi:L-seryl-tRNA(Ser) seleniumtransferase
MDALLRRPAVEACLRRYRREVVHRWLAEILERLRTELRAWESDAPPAREAIVDRAEALLSERIAGLEGLGLRPVVNAGGVIVHTNLGRSPLPPAVLARLPAVLSGYVNLEFDLETGARGHRDTHLAALLRELLPCEDATAVNNCAGAVLLVLRALAGGGEVIVSRGELVEIGGSFRIPEILAAGGAVLREVGTTNKTRLADYAAAIGPETRLILQVHRSNFEIVGFTEQPSVAELAELARRARLPLVVDAGSGYLFTIPGAPIRKEPVIEEVLRAGASLVCFSGDKLLGGAQAGLILGEGALVAAVRRDPLMRALRLDKLVLFVLTETLKSYFHTDTARQLPVLALATADPVRLRRRAAGFRTRLLRAVPAAAGAVRVEPGVSLLGGGSTPGQEVPGWVVAIALPPDKLTAIERLFLAGNPPIVARTDEGRLLLDLRTVAPGGEKAILSRLVQAHHQGIFP